MMLKEKQKQRKLNQKELIKWILYKMRIYQLIRLQELI